MATNQASLVASSSAPGVLYLYGAQARVHEDVDFSTDMTDVGFSNTGVNGMVAVVHNIGQSNVQPARILPFI